MANFCPAPVPNGRCELASALSCPPRIIQNTGGSTRPSSGQMQPRNR